MNNGVELSNHLKRAFRNGPGTEPFLSALCIVSETRSTMDVDVIRLVQRNSRNTVVFRLMTVN